MKFLFASLLSLCLSAQLTAVAQFQSLFGNQSTSWKFSGRYLYLNLYVYDSVTVTAEEVIGGVPYKRLVGSCYDDQMPSSVNFTNEYGHLREDAATGKAWYLAPNNQAPELLVYDMNLNVGDTMQVSMDIPYNAAVDSVYFANGRKHIRFNYLPPTDTLRQAPEKLTMIEGIGTNYGFDYMGPSSFSMSEEVLLCAYKNQVQVFAHSIIEAGYSGCRYDQSLAATDQELQQSLVLLPNPASGQVLLRTGEVSLPANAQLYLTDLLGRRVAQTTIQQGQKEVLVGLSGVTAGVYLVTLLHEGELRWRQRLVVQ